MISPEQMLWRRLDTPGHDACRLDVAGPGWRLAGTAVFQHAASPAILAYGVDCDHAWCTSSAWVRGTLDGHPVQVVVSRSSGVWRLNDIAVPGLDACVDVDLGFTPATNLLPIRRLGLAQGETSEAPAAWFDVHSGTLSVLPERYARRSESIYWYEAPAVGYAAELEVTSAGFVRRYPGLWEEEGRA